MNLLINKETVYPLIIEIENRGECFTLIKLMASIAKALCDDEKLRDHIESCKNDNCNSDFHELGQGLVMSGSIANSLIDVYHKTNN